MLTRKHMEQVARMQREYGQPPSPHAPHIPKAQVPPEASPTLEVIMDTVVSLRDAQRSLTLAFTSTMAEKWEEEADMLQSKIRSLISRVVEERDALRQQLEAVKRKFPPMEFYHTPRAEWDKEGR